MKKNIVHPRELLFRKYILNSGKSIYRWADDLGMSTKGFRSILKGSYLFTIPFAEKLAKLTNTTARYWIKTQRAYLLYEHQKSSIDQKITRIKLKACRLKRGRRYPGVVLDRMTARFNMTYVQLARRLRIGDESLYRIIAGSSRIDSRHAVKLGTIFETGCIYWLDLQAEQDLEEYVSKKGIAYQTLGAEWKINSEKGFSRNNEPVHPGLILSRDFILPTKISKYDWSRYFCVNRKYLHELLKGKKYLSIKLIATISKAFGTKPEYWIRIQNQFIAWKGEKGLKKTRCNGRVGVSGVSLKNIPPGKILRSSYLKPLNWAVREFAEHIGIRYSELRNVIVGKKSIDAKIETKLNQALGTPLMFWTDLQIEWDFFKAAKRRNKISRG